MIPQAHPDDARLDRKVLILDREDRHRLWLSRIARSVVTTVDATGEVGAALDPAAYDLVIINRDGFSPEERRSLLDTFKESRAGQRAPHPLLVSSAKEGYQQLFEECEGYGLTNLLAKNEEVDAVELIVTIQKILQNDIFGLQKYFPWGVPIRSLTINSSSERREIIRQAEQYARDLRVAPRLVEGFSVVIEELIANALFNAPIDGETGKPRYAHRSRADTITLEPGEEVEVTLCCDAYKLGVSVSDKFGALDVDRCLGHLVRCFRKGADQVSDQPGGAGLGLYFSFDSLSHFVLNIARGKRTEVIGLLGIHGSYREFANRSKSFNCFVEAQEEP